MARLSKLRQTTERQQGTLGLDSAQVVALGGSSGVTVYDSLNLLPVSSLTAGDEAYVKSNNRYYISNGSGWYNAALVNAAPYWDSEPLASYDIADSATPLIITAKALDSDNPDTILVNQSSGTDSAQYLVTITNDSSVFTFTPKSQDSINASVTAGDLTDSDTNDFIYTFKWSDGISFISKAVTINYNFADTSTIAYAMSQGSGIYSITATDGNESGTTKNVYVDATKGMLYASFASDGLIASTYPAWQANRIIGTTISANDMSLSWSSGVNRLADGVTDNMGGYTRPAGAIAYFGDGGATADLVVDTYNGPLTSDGSTALNTWTVVAGGEFLPGEVRTNGTYAADITATKTDLTATGTFSSGSNDDILTVREDAGIVHLYDIWVKSA